MKQQEFEARHDAHWRTLEQLLSTLKKNRKTPGAAAGDLAGFPQRYRQLCHHLALARERRYAPYLIDRLEALVLDGHQYLYRARNVSSSSALKFIGVTFPSLVRAELRLVALALALLYLPAVAMGLAVHYAPEMVYTLMDPHQAAEMESMYDPAAAHIGRERASDTDFMMFGHYIKNNIGISFQTFAGGLVYGIGSIFYLVYNGLFFGGIAGHLTRLGYGTTFYPFVVGHGAFELTAIALSGAAGLKIGLALLLPGRKTRLGALGDAAQISMRIMYGVAGMLLIAAFIEAFWSSSQAVVPAVKYAVGGLLWLGVASYFVWAGRVRAA
ncbi:MAG: stage II sporulation protein M [Thiobacillus sp.]|nr:stage II sporulation protein M [Thiobacillus sp.]